ALDRRAARGAIACRLGERRVRGRVRVALAATEAAPGDRVARAAPVDGPRVLRLGRPGPCARTAGVARPQGARAHRPPSSAAIRFSVGGCDAKRFMSAWPPAVSGSTMNMLLIAGLGLCSGTRWA